MTAAELDAPAVAASRSFSGRAMASALTMTLVGAGTARPGAAEGTWSTVLDEFEACEEAMSRFRETSEITALDRAALDGRPMAVSPRLRRAVVACDRAHRITGRRFDPRVVGLLDAWGYRGADLGRRVATDLTLSSERIATVPRRHTIRLSHPIDLGGIGKGLALRWAADRVHSAGFDRFIIDAGGDIVARGPAPEGGPWGIGVEDPRGGADPIAVAALWHGAIATSSIRRLRWTAEGRERHHLVDPTTGEPADGGLMAVTVAAIDPAWAEVWSKSLFVAGRSDIAALARSRGLAAWWVDVDGRLGMTPAARQRTMWVAGEG